MATAHEHNVCLPREVLQSFQGLHHHTLHDAVLSSAPFTDVTDVTAVWQYMYMSSRRMYV